MASKIITKGLKRTALSVALGMCFAGSVLAQSNTSGSIGGKTTAGATVLIENPSTGFRREVTADSEGNYKVGSLATGTYKVTTGGTTRDVTVTIGTTSSLDTVTVVGSVVNAIDVSSVESNTILTEAQIDRLPVSRDATAVALLAPGTVRGDGRFGNLASFGGASVAENVYYINGFNVTNIVSGLAFNEVPFEAVAEQQVKTGGYGAEFGRSLGGVINVITKRGTNDWKFGGNVFWAPDSLADGTKIAFDPDNDGSYKTVDTGSVVDGLKYNIWGGGPILKDRLFFFALYQGRQDDNHAPYDGGVQDFTRESPQYLFKIDWNITDNHLLEYTQFSDTNQVEDGFQNGGDIGTIGGDDNADNDGTFTSRTGGKNQILRWTGYITDNFTLSALYGKGVYKREAADSTSVGCPLVQDVRSIPNRIAGCWINSLVSNPAAGDEREAWRVDGSWVIGDHTLKFGLDNEEFTTVDGSSYPGTYYEPATPGGIYFRYVTTSPGVVLPNGFVIPNGMTEYVRLRYFENGGTFVTKNEAWYIEDTWQVTDNFLAYVGVRNESFENLNSLGGSFIDIKDTWAPRLGFSWDVNGDSSFKVFGNAGRYYIPVYANTNVRLAGAELDYADYYAFTSIDPITGIPVLGAQLGGRFVTSDGGVPDPRAVVDNNLSPMYQDEYILGFQHQINANWSIGVRGIFRDLKSGMDDICTGQGASDWALENGYTQDQADAIFAALDHCFLTNPGLDLSANVDLDGTGELTVVEIPGDVIGIPVAERYYKALEFFFERSWDDKWFLQGSYTWAKSYGNTEGYVKSDNGQDDAGITQDFDYPGLTDGAYGYLPNDRRHSLKLFGAYQLTDEWRIGANLLIQSGRPQNCFGVYPDAGPDDVAPNYGVASFYCGAQQLPDGSEYTDALHTRGTSGRVPWVQTVDFQVAYEPKAVEGLSFRMDIRNLFDSEDYFRVQDNYEDVGLDPLPSYGHPRGYVAPRRVEFSVEYNFNL